MTDEGDFEEFSDNFRRDIIDAAQDPESESFKEEQFTEKFLDHLVDIAAIEDYNLCRLAGKGFKINAYNSNLSTQNNNDKEGIFFDLVVSDYTNDYSRATISKNEIQLYAKRLRTFLSVALNKQYSKFEESNPAFDLADTIYKNKENIVGINLFVITDGTAKSDPIPDETEGKIRISYHIWDLNRLFRLVSSGNWPEPIEIDFIKEFGEVVPCLEALGENQRYKTYLAIMPGKMIAGLYGRFGPKLLERNIRVFLQMKSKVNKGIRDTIHNESYMFLAYNNGISTTAEDVKLEKNRSGITGISWLRDFQIVNGGQTTAAIHYTSFKEKCDISEVQVQVKLTVLKNQDDMKFIVPKIAQYANSQNKISESDFVSNEEFHIEIQKVSRTVWAAKKGSQLETHWYYERARGQYQVDKERELTAKQKKVFSERNPPGQKFTKTDLAKYENSSGSVSGCCQSGESEEFPCLCNKTKKWSSSDS